MSRARYLRNRRLKCGCTGYWFPHRAGGGACVYGYKHIYYILRRQGADEMTALAEWAFETPGRQSFDPPF